MVVMVLGDGAGIVVGNPSLQLASLAHLFFRTTEARASLKKAKRYET